MSYNRQQYISSTIYYLLHSQRTVTFGFLVKSVNVYIFINILKIKNKLYIIFFIIKKNSKKYLFNY